MSLNRQKDQTEAATATSGLGKQLPLDHHAQDPHIHGDHALQALVYSNPISAPSPRAHETQGTGKHKQVFHAPVLVVRCVRIGEYAHFEKNQCTSDRRLLTSQRALGHKFDPKDRPISPKNDSPGGAVIWEQISSDTEQVLHVRILVVICGILRRIRVRAFFSRAL